MGLSAESRGEVVGDVEEALGGVSPVVLVPLSSPERYLGETGATSERERFPDAREAVEFEGVWSELDRCLSGSDSFKVLRLPPILMRAERSILRVSESADEFSTVARFSEAGLDLPPPITAVMARAGRARPGEAGDC